MDSKKESKGFLTNEEISRTFKSQFELVNYAIKKAEQIVLSDKEHQINDVRNPVLLVLDDIVKGKDSLIEPMSMHEEEADSLFIEETERSSKRQKASVANNGVNEEESQAFKTAKNRRKLLVS